MSDKQQSAVDFLVSHFEQAGIDYGFFKPTIDQAKELFKQQIIDATMEFMNTDGIPNEKELAEQYFNDRFKTESNGNSI